MDEQIREAFRQLHAGEAMKENTKAALDRARNRRRRPVGYLAVAAACLVLLLAGLGGYRYYFTPTTYLSVDINPSLELGVNRFDKVVSVRAWNEDGQELVDSLELNLLDYQEALERLVASESIADRLAAGELLSITVAGENETQCSRLLAGAEACTAGQENVRCHQGDVEELEQAHHAGLSLGKYQAFLELQALDPTVTAQDVQDMTMRQIRDWIGSLSQDADSQGKGNGQGHHGEESHGYRFGQS